MSEPEMPPASSDTATPAPTEAAASLAPSTEPSNSTPSAVDSTTSNDAVTEPSADPSAPPMTKSALKRLRRQEQYESQKIARRAREKEKKKTKAAEKRKAIEEGTLEKPESSKKRKKENDSEGKKKIEFGARVVLDVGFDELMNEKEVKSMSSQVAYCYAANRNATNPFPILVSSFSGRLKDSYDKRQDHFNWKGVEWWEEGFERLYQAEEEEVEQSTAEPPSTSDETATAPEKVEEEEVKDPVKMGVHAGRPKSTAPKSSIIYLTGDSPNVLTHIEPGHTYVLGGIVDRNRYKSLCLNKANELGIKHAQLPIGQYLPEMATRKVLTVNQVYEIMVNWVESLREQKESLRKEGKTEEEVEKEAQGDWRESLRKVMPVRKFDKDGKAKKRAEKRAEKRKQQQAGDGVYVVELDDDEDDEEDEDDDDAQDESMQELSVTEGALADKSEPIEQETEKVVVP